MPNFQSLLAQNNFIGPFKMEKSTAAATALITLIKSIREGKLSIPQKLVPQGHLPLFFYNQILMIVKPFNTTLPFHFQLKL